MVGPGPVAQAGWPTLPEPVVQVVEFLQFPGWEAVVFIAALIAAVILSKYPVRLLGRPVARRFTRQSIAQVALRGIRIGIVVLISVFVASALGFELGNIVLSVTVFSAVVGVILAPIVGSIINGVFVLADQPFEIGDLVELPDGTRGYVEDITLRYTKVITMDNTFEVIPNNVIRESKVTNYSAEDERTRLSLPLVVTYEGDLEQARRVAERAAGNCDTVIEGGPDIRIGTARYPANPTCYIDEFGDHGIRLILRYWAKQPYKLLTVRSQVQTEVWRMLVEEDLDVRIAYPHQHLVFDETSGTAQVSVNGSDPGK